MIDVHLDRDMDIQGEEVIQTTVSDNASTCMEGKILSNTIHHNKYIINL